MSTLPASAVAQAFKAYQAGILKAYGAQYPPSARANGQLANVVGRVGAANVVAVVDWYIGHRDIFYSKTKHSIDLLVRDCEKLFLELQAATGAQVAKPPTHANVALLKPDGEIARNLQRYPIGDFEVIARQALRDYARMIASLGPKYIVVHQGDQRRQFSIEELRA